MSIKSVLIFVGVSVGLLVGLTALLWNFSTQAEQPVPEVKGEMRHILGEGEIVVTEFSDLQCPACAGVQQPLKELMRKYEGRVKLVYRHLPLTSIHKNAMAAATASEAAYEQGKFWEYHDLLFARQSEWGELGDPREKFAAYAQELGMDGDKLVADMERDDLTQIVLSDSAAATRYKVQATPSFFVEGERVEFAGLEEKIASKLAR